MEVDEWASLSHLLQSYSVGERELVGVNFSEKWDFYHRLFDQTACIYRQYGKIQILQTITEGAISQGCQVPYLRAKSSLH